MNTSRKLACSLVAVLIALCGAPRAADKSPPSRNYKVGETLEKAQTLPPIAPGDFRTIEWDALMPKNWEPLKKFKRYDFGIFGDQDPRARAALEELKQAWQAAPTVPEMDGARVRIPGFVVPLESDRSGLREFLLVPYFGACIHVPPPPANQIIHVTLAKPLKGTRTMDALWVGGTLKVVSSDSAMGRSAYRMQAEVAEPYKER